MSIDVLIGILIPFVGTALGAACVFFLKNQIPALVQKGLLGFASGVMVAASVWSLLIIYRKRRFYGRTAKEVFQNVSG